MIVLGINTGPSASCLEGWGADGEANSVCATLSSAMGLVGPMLVLWQVSVYVKFT